MATSAICSICLDPLVRGGHHQMHHRVKKDKGEKSENKGEKEGEIKKEKVVAVEEQDEDEEDVYCPIVATVPCGHAYHEKCLKQWAKERLNEDHPEILCPCCNSQVANVCKLYLSTKSVDDDFHSSLTHKELECWRQEYHDYYDKDNKDNKDGVVNNTNTQQQNNTTNSGVVDSSSTSSARLQLHAKVLESNKRTIDEIFEKQKILETYEKDRLALEKAKTENQQLRKELFDEMMRREAEMRRLQANKQIIQEVLERNEKALTELKQTREENLDLKRELLRGIMGRQNDMKKLADSKQALSGALENQELALSELKKSREENLALKQELVSHLHHHKMKMEQLHSHKQSLHEIVVSHGQNIEKLEEIKQENFSLKEQLIQSMVLHKKDATQLATCEGWIQVLKEEVKSFEEERVTLKLIRQENGRLGTILQQRQRRYMKSRQELNTKIHESAFQKMNLLVGFGQLALFGLVLIGLKR